jgi:hypothetical protein
MTKKLNRFGRIFYWPDTRTHVCNFERRCQDCQWAKPIQDSRVGLHSSEVATKPLERIFIGFLGPNVKNQRASIAILVVLGGLSKFACIYPVKKISPEMVKNCLLDFFNLSGFLNQLSLTMLPSSSPERSTTRVSSGEFVILPPRPIISSRRR